MSEKYKVFWGGALCSMLFLNPLPGSADAASSLIQVDNRTDLINYSLSGPGQASSFYQAGGHILHETDIRAENTHDNSWESTMNLNFRLTDNDQFDPEKASIERLSLKLNNDRVQLDFGDYFANFSQYSMNKSIKGLGAQVNFNDKENYLRLAYGIFDPQWEYLYQTPNGEGMDRFGGGLRYQMAREKYRVGLNFGYVRDDADDKNRSTEDAYLQYVPAVDWEYRLEGLVFNGESAYSDTEATTVGDVKTETTGNAHRISAKARMDDLKLNGKWERVSPDFVPLGGGATPDRQRFYGKADYDLAKNWDLFGIFDHSADNLDSQLSTTTTNITGELGVKRKRAFNRNSMNISLSARRKWNDTEDNSRESTSDRIKFGIDDRIAKVIRVSGDFEAVLDDDTTPGGPSTSDFFYNLSLSSRHRLKDGDLELRPRFSVSLQERENLTANGDDFTTNMKLDIDATYQKFLRFGIDAEMVQNDIKNGEDSLRKKIGAFCEIRPDWLQNGSVRLEAASNEYDFDTNTSDYREEIVKLMLRYSFEKKGGE